MTTVRKVGSVFVDLDELTDTVDLREIFGSDVVQCPWHDDHDPSLHIYPDHVYCYSCGQWQDAIGFVMAYNKITFDEAVKYLWKRKSSTAPRKRIITEPVPMEQVRGWSDKLLSFSNSGWPWHYLLGRGLNRQIVQDLLIGWTGMDYSIPHMANGKVFNVKFRIHPEKGPGPKYRSMPHRTFDYLYPWDYFRKNFSSELVHITEGEFDAAILLQHGLPALSLPSGANSKWDLWVSALRGFKVVRLCLDQDEAGRNSIAQLNKKGPTGRSVLDMLPNTKFERITWSPDLWGKDVTDARNALIPRLRGLMNGS